MTTLDIPQRKAIRAAALVRWMRASGVRRCVCLSCGNASRALIEAGANCVDVSPSGALMATHWLRGSDVARCFPGHFDATSGHLTVELMAMVGNALRAVLGPLPSVCEVKCGSGETLCSLALAYPDVQFVAVYGSEPWLKYEPAAPLNPLVERLASQVKRPGR